MGRFSVGPDGEPLSRLSLVILTSRRAHIGDPCVPRLANVIIEAQVREIGEMKRLLA